MVVPVFFLSLPAIELDRRRSTQGTNPALAAESTGNKKGMYALRSFSAGHARELHLFDRSVTTRARVHA
jgi:hypothetical protein